MAAPLPAQFDVEMAAVVQEAPRADDSRLGHADVPGERLARTEGDAVGPEPVGGQLKGDLEGASWDCAVGLDLMQPSEHFGGEFAPSLCRLRATPVRRIGAID